MKKVKKKHTKVAFFRSKGVIFIFFFIYLSTECHLSDRDG